MNSLDSDLGFHRPVLLDEAVSILRVKKGGIYIDATIGGGGHTARILEKGGMVLGIDLDRDAILHLKKKFESEICEGRLMLACGNYAGIKSIAQHYGMERVDGILFDLGLSSYQIGKSGRGFSFLQDEPLDMRVDKSSNLTAWEIVNTWSENELFEIFLKFGEERFSRKIAERIIEARKTSKIKTTQKLSDLVSEIVHNSKKIHPATRVFQALRIVVNSEIENLKKGIEYGFELLNEGAVLAVISFHSIEDRTVKLYFLRLEASDRARILTKKPITASREEIQINRRARSAKLRALKKLRDI